MNLSIFLVVSAVTVAELLIVPVCSYRQICVVVVVPHTADPDDPLRDQQAED